jgi:hypothetical protein
MLTLKNKSLEELINLHLTYVKWRTNITLGFILSNNESCIAGSAQEVNMSHIFDPKKKITKVEVIIHKGEDTFV